jgi:glycosyltransferase involved in cell wall biosynthesis
MPGVYAGLDILALTSLNEGTPMTVLEAMAAGKPVVAVDVGGLADILDDGTTGYLVKKGGSGGTDAALAARLGDLLDDRPGAEKMGRAGRARIRERHSPDGQADALEEIYRNGGSSRR